MTAIAAELATAPLALQTATLAHVNARCPADVWGDEADTGRAYLAAHLATVALRRGAGGFVSEQHAGPVGQSFALLPGLAGVFGTTTYGQTYELLVSSLVGARLPVMGGVG